jgi:hypothetical protein
VISRVMDPVLDSSGLIAPTLGFFVSDGVRSALVGFDGDAAGRGVHHSIVALVRGSANHALALITRWRRVGPVADPD